MTTTQTPIASPETPSLERHARKRKICKHNDREDIELDFLHWHAPCGIFVEYELGDTSVIYLHAHATGLFDRRMLELKFAAAHIVDRAESVTPTGAVVLQAIQACSEINEQGEWIQTPRRIIDQVEHHQAPLPALPLKNLEVTEPESSEPQGISNRDWTGLENAASSTKH